MQTSSDDSAADPWPHIAPLLDDAVDALAAGAELSGQQIRVLAPISLLRCKVNLALTVPGKSWLPFVKQVKTT